MTSNDDPQPAEHLKKFLDGVLHQELEGNQLESSFKQAYYSILAKQTTKDKRYPRLAQYDIHRIIRLTQNRLTKEGTLLPVRASRLLVVDKGYGLFTERIKQVITKQGRRMSPDEVKRVSEKIILEEVLAGHEDSAGYMDPILVPHLGGPFEGMNVATSPGLTIEPGTLGVIADVERDPYFHYLNIFWEGFDEEHPGRIARLPHISWRPGEQYDLKILWDSQPEDLGITAHLELIRYSNDPRFAQIREARQ